MFLIVFFAVAGITASPILLKRGDYPARIPNTEVFMINGTATVQIYIYINHIQYFIFVNSKISTLSNYRMDGLCLQTIMGKLSR